MRCATMGAGSAPRSLDPTWAPYEPTPDSPWDLSAVAHLHRRAGFGAPWERLERDQAEGPEAAIHRVIHGEPTARDGRPSHEFDAQADRLAQQVATSSADIQRLQAAWLLRMINTPHPLRERLTLFWHDHFATSNTKVRHADLMRRQNDLLRQQALGNFRVLLREMARDPAMLIWLDAATNRRAHPNENYAREVMELFALGRGNYSEKDIQEAARAFTGTFIQDDRYRERPAHHDDGPKTILGQTGRFRADDVARILLDQPACATFLCQKLCQLFLSDLDPVPESLVTPLAEAFRESDYDVSVPVRMILASQRFFEPRFRGQRVKSPAELVVGTIRALQIHSPTLPPDQLAESTAAMGQSLFEPPSVNGWDSGPSWLNTTTSLARLNFLLGLAADPRRFQMAALTAQHGASSDPPEFFTRLLLARPLDERLTSSLGGDPDTVAAAVLTLPEYQLA